MVSHSASLANGVVELAGQMAGPELRLTAAGGDARGGIGTDETALRAAIETADDGDGVLVLGDLGSAILTIRQVIEESGNGHVRLADAPLVEGAVAAAVMASVGSSLDDVVKAAEEARHAPKF